jgi:hypothetical protein
MLARTNGTLPEVTTAVAERTKHRWWSLDLRSIGMVFATNTTLFCALDMAQWVADRYSLSMLPTNLVAAVFATSLGLAFAAQGFRDRPPSHARAAPRGQPFAAWRPIARRQLVHVPVMPLAPGNARTAALVLPSVPRSRPSTVSARDRPPARPHGRASRGRI